MVKTKIIATLGPKSKDETTLRKMYREGLDVARLNFSHGTHEQHIKCIESVRSLNKKMRRSIKILQDLAGYRIRIGKLKEPILLKKNSIVYLTQREIIGVSRIIPFDYKGCLRRIKKGALVYIDDGKIGLEVIGKEAKSLKVKVMNTGILRERKGVNILGAKYRIRNIAGLSTRWNSLIGHTL